VSPFNRFKKEEMTMSKITTGVGLCALALSIVAFPIIDRALPRAEATVPTAAVQAIASAAHAQAGGEPTVVWYGVSDAKPHPYWSGQGIEGKVLFRAWSDGTIEARIRYIAFPDASQCAANPGASPWIEPPYCGGGWKVISSPTEGFKAAADSNADEKVDGEDLAAVLSNWGDAPRVPFPPSDCPLNLVNP
jgi:hypothetical protein